MAPGTRLFLIINSMFQIGQFSSIPYVLQTVCAVSLATFTDFLIQRKVLSITTTRKLAAFFSKCEPRQFIVSWPMAISRKLPSFYWLFAGLIVAGVLVGFMVFCGCNLVLSLSIFTAVSILNGSALAGIQPNLVDLSPNFTGKVWEKGLDFTITGTGFLDPSCSKRVTWIIFMCLQQFWTEWKDSLTATSVIFLLW